MVYPLHTFGGYRLGARHTKELARGTERGAALIKAPHRSRLPSGGWGHSAAGTYS